MEFNFRWMGFPIGKDKLSDMTTNIIREHLIDYTQNQCKLHGILMNFDFLKNFSLIFRKGTQKYWRNSNKRQILTL